MPIFNKSKFYPQNLLLLVKGDESIDAHMEQICAEAYSLSPESFNSERLFFKFTLRYCPPYEHNHFRELKRLQEVARNNTRFKDEYKGYIAINISEWTGHLSEELFKNVTMAFLCDMSDNWKYVFISDESGISDVDMNILCHFFKVKRLDDKSFLEMDHYHRFFEGIEKNYDIRFSAVAADLLRKFISPRTIQNKETKLALERDIKNYFGISCKVDKKMLLEHFVDEDSICYDLIKEKDIKEIKRMIGDIQRV